MYGFLFLIVCFLGASLLHAQDFTGTYALPTSRGQITLTLRANPSGGYSGTLVGDDGITFQVEAKREGSELVGYLLKPNQSGNQFELVAMVEAALEGQRLKFFLVPLDAKGNPQHDNAIEAVYQKQAEGQPGRPSPAGPVPPSPLTQAPAGQSGGFTGSFQGEIAGTATQLTLEQRGNTLTGKADAGGYLYTLQGTVNGNTASGTLHDPNTGGNVAFQASLAGGTLKLTLLVPDPATGQSQHLDLNFRPLTPGSTAEPSVTKVAPQQASPGNPSTAPPSATPPAESSATQLVAGQQYAPGTRIQVPSAGVSFVLPPEWLGGMPRGKPAFLMGSNTRPGLGMIIPHGQYDAQQVLRGLNGPQDFGEGVVLFPAGPPRQEGDKTWLHYTGGPYVGYALVLPGPYKNAVVLAFVGPAQESQYYQQLIESMAAGVRFSAPQAGAESQQWRQLLAGMMLKQLDSYYSGSFDGSYVGGSSEKTLHLCSDGSFAYFSSSSVAGDAGLVGGYSGSSGNETGRWEVQTMGGQAVLVLKYASGQQSQHILTYDGQKTFLDGKRVYRVKSDRCY